MAEDKAKKNEAVENDLQAVEETIEDLVVAFVPNRYHLPLPEGGHKEYVSGDVVMPRAHADHWFSKAQKVRIVGVPDIKSIKSADAAGNIATLKEIVSTALVKVEALHTLNDLSKPQAAALAELNKSMLAINEAFGKFVAAVEFAEV
jgi:hypothetical protein